MTTIAFVVILNSMKNRKNRRLKPSKPEEPQLTAVRVGRVDEGLGRGSRVDQSARNGSHRRTAQMATRQGAADGGADPDPQTVCGVIIGSMAVAQIFSAATVCGVQQVEAGADDG